MLTYFLGRGSLSSRARMPRNCMLVFALSKVSFPDRSTSGYIIQMKEAITDIFYLRLSWPLSKKYLKLCYTLIAIMFKIYDIKSFYHIHTPKIFSTFPPTVYMVLLLLYKWFSTFCFVIGLPASWITWLYLAHAIYLAELMTCLDNKPSEWLLSNPNNQMGKFPLKRYFPNEWSWARTRILVAFYHFFDFIKWRK